MECQFTYEVGLGKAVLIGTRDFRFWEEDENEYEIWLPCFSENA